MGRRPAAGFVLVRRDQHTLGRAIQQLPWQGRHRGRFTDHGRPAYRQHHEHRPHALRRARLAGRHRGHGRRDGSGQPRHHTSQHRRGGGEPHAQRCGRDLGYPAPRARRNRRDLRGRRGPDGVLPRARGQPHAGGRGQDAQRPGLLRVHGHRVQPGGLELTWLMF